MTRSFHELSVCYFCVTLHPEETDIVDTLTCGTNVHPYSSALTGSKQAQIHFKMHLHKCVHRRKKKKNTCKRFVWVNWIIYMIKVSTYRLEARGEAGERQGRGQGWGGGEGGVGGAGGERGGQRVGQRGAVARWRLASPDTRGYAHLYTCLL